MVIGTDSYLGHAQLVVACDGPKWFSLSGVRFLDAGSARASQVVKHTAKFRRARKREDAERYMVTVVAPAIARALEDVDMTAEESSFLAVFGGEIWTIGGDLGVFRAVEGYAAAGAGEAYAMGALAATAVAADPRWRDPMVRVRRALEAAEKHCPGVRGPMHVERLAA